MASVRPRVVRWLGAYRKAPAGRRAAAVAEAFAFMRERAAEPLWHGYSLVLSESPHVMVGLAFDPCDVTRAFWRDVWSEPQGVHLVATAEWAPRPYRVWDRFARVWARYRPDYHGEVWVHANAAPIAVAVRAGCPEARAIGHDIAAELDLPLAEVKPLRR
jgi:hypothetical protein